MAYKMKIMTEAQIKEVDELWHNGHSEALMAYGWECVNAWRTGFRQGIVKTCAKGAVGALAVVGALGIVGIVIDKVENRKKQEQLIEEQQDYDE